MASLLIGLLNACNSVPVNTNTRFGDDANAQFWESIAGKPQTFDLDPTKDNYLQGKDGTFIFIEKNTLVNAQGNIPANAKIELVEALTPANMIKNGLTSTTSDGRLLETDGMIYLNAKDGQGQPLQIKKGSKIWIDAPSLNNVEGIQAFQGEFSKNKQLQWKNPTPTDKYLTSLPLKKLHFYPNPPKNKTKIVYDRRDSVIYANYCGISKKLVDTLIQEKFNKTLIATLEFETRMRYIHKSCNEEVLNLYLQNMEKNMWEIDSLAFELLQKENNSVASAFKILMQQRKTKVKNGRKLDKAYLESIQKFGRKQRITQLTRNTFATTSLGWINYDRFLHNPNAKEQPLTVIPQNIDKAKVLKITMMFLEAQSLASLIRNEKGNFDLISYRNTHWKLPKGLKVALIAIGKDDETAYLGIKEIKIGDHENENISMKKVTAQQLAKQIDAYNKPRSPKLQQISGSKNCCRYEPGLKVIAN
ncbi:hypothetical protein BKI52_43320 [marine bacterium AO1-C]|nr:hypothetical protein BKI52_43320 [marine bacterium AO1-C]